MVCIARWDVGSGDMAVAWLAIIMLGLLALTGLADIIANHYRGKLKPAPRIEPTHR